DRMETPATHQWSFGVGHRVTEHLALNVDYIDQHIVHLPVTVKRNTATPRLTSLYGSILLWGDFGDATYRAYMAGLTYDRSGRRLNVAYTLGWARSEFAGDADYGDSASYNMQQSAGDERHRIVV